MVDPDGIAAGPARTAAQGFAAPDAAADAGNAAGNAGGNAGNAGGNAANVGVAPNVGDAANRAIVGNAGAGVAPGSVPPFSPGAFAGLIVASIFCFGLVGVIVGWMNVKHPARKSQATALIVIGAVVIGLSVIYGLAAAAAESGGSDF